MTPPSRIKLFFDHSSFSHVHKIEGAGSFPPTPQFQLNARWQSDVGNESLLLGTEGFNAEFHDIASLQITWRLLTHANAGGVPVEMTSPGCSDMNWLR